MNKKRILIIVFNNIKTDVRVLRQINTLKNEYFVSLISYGGEAIEGIEMINIPRVTMPFHRKVMGVVFLLTHLYRWAYQQIYRYKYLESIKELKDFDLILANDIETLPLAFSLKGNSGTKVIFDAHEYATRQFENDRKWRILFKGFNEYISGKYIPKVNAMITQNKLFASEFENEYGVTAEIMINAPEFQNISVKTVDMKNIRIVHHGIYNTTRNIEKLLDMIRFLDERYSLYLMLHLPSLSNAASRQKFETFCQLAREEPRVTLLEPVAGGVVVESIQGYDIGVHILEPINYNHAYSLPNKILEFVQARLAAVIGPSPGMVDIVNTHNIGVVADDFSARSIATSISNITEEELMNYKNNSDKAAFELSSEQSKKVLKSVIEDELTESN